ncbi:sulfatase-like hydrolase/transferase [Flammeovirga pacifica]|uniref:Choline-sulfatase n=1 Tax=Flammeovirga pacifica TaxID=915059 RepID=A0A1S1YS00_FLAPC|nr:sulfatase-like hydrolase/transferase [Flammeovirga pacifica]OHX63806.1 choline-sulfatase [Flammeovirga pacifica]
MKRELIYLLLCILQLQAIAQDKQPNILFIFADDQCYQTTKAGGNNEIKMPNLDKLADQGVHFSHAYNMGSWSAAVCMASRTMLNTGKTVWNAHQFIKNKNTEAYWSKMMSNAGYTTYFTGKWHLKIEVEKLFDHVKHPRRGMPSDHWNKEVYSRIKEAVRKGEDTQSAMPFGYARPKNEEDQSWLPWDKSNGGYWEGGTHWSEVVANDAIEFIDHAKKEEKPFFMYVAFNAGHDPRQSPKEFIEMYPLENIKVPETFQPEYPQHNELKIGPSLRDEALAPFPRTEHAVKVHRQEYYALLSHMDQQIGRILEHLKTTNQLENTYIIYTADHGLAVGNHGLLGKQNMYDHSLRVPLFIIGPSLSKQKIEADIYIQDIMPTCLELAGNATETEFNSLLPFLNDESKTSYYDGIYSGLMNTQRAIRKDNYKLIVYPTIQKELLFDLEKDPNELENLASSKAHKKIKKELFKSLLKLQEELNDPLELKNINRDEI